MIIFYVRCSTKEQNEKRQLLMAEECKADKVYIDKLSGKNLDRPEFNKMMAFIREGDTLITESISRLARSAQDLLKIIEELTNKGITYISLKEKFDSTTPTGKFILTIFGALAELEREYIRSRQAEGIEIAKKEGKYHGRPPKSIDLDSFHRALEMVRHKERTALSVQKEFYITATTYYRWVKTKPKLYEYQHFSGLHNFQ